MSVLRAFFRLFNPLAWPMWLKLAAGFIFGIGIPVAVIALVTQSGFNTIGEQNLRGYIEENGQRQQAAIVEELENADTTLETFLADQAHQARVVGLLDPGTYSLIGARELGETLQNILLGSRAFTKIRVMNRAGQIVSSANEQRILVTIVDDPTDPTYAEAETALIEGRQHNLVVYGDPVTLEISEAIVEADEVVGFVIVTLNVDHIIYDNLRFAQNAYPAYSYLVTLGPNPILIAPKETLPQARASLTGSTIVERVRRGGAGVSLYRNGANQEVIGFNGTLQAEAAEFSSIFALVLEVAADTPQQQVSGYFSGSRLFPLVIGVALVLVILVLLFNQIIAPPLSTLRQAMQAAAHGNFDEPVRAAGRGDEIGDVSAAFVDMRVQVRNLLDDLQARVAARTRDMAATQEISHFAATQQNLQTLMDQVVQLIIDRFPNIYHAQIFLLDQEATYALLRASTGEPGKLLLARGHRLAVGSISVIGQVTEQRQTVIARDTTASQVHRRNEFLPDTRAELAIPLQMGSKLIGALDVQSKYRNAFTEDEVNVLQTMADQLAVAIENARLYQESVRRLEDIEAANRLSTLATWQEYIYGQRQRQLSSQAGLATGTDMSALRRAAVEQGRIVAGSVTANNTVPIAVPIQLRGHIVGAVEWELPASDFSENKLQLAQELANRLAVSLENARLFEESQRATERERIVNAIAAKLTPQTEISEILQTAVREVGQALRVPQVNIRLTSANGKNGSSGANGSHE